MASLLSEIRGRLKDAEIESSQQEAGWLLDCALGLSSVTQVIEGDRRLSSDQVAKVEALVTRRVGREPLQYLLGTQEFCGLDFAVTPDVLIPRPETELLVEQIVREIPVEQPATIVDVGTGSGCIAVMLARLLPSARIIASDISEKSLEVARKNARRHAVEDRILWFAGDLLGPLADLELEGQIDLIVSNPPYIADADWAALQPEVQFEPKRALVAGRRGTECHERLLKESRSYLSPQGMLILEIGLGQGPAIRNLLGMVGGYEPASFVHDAAGIERVVMARRNGD
ncbi:MAG TPA: peptide chain release factor N(5)-glutamine methyltransferase [Nitrospiraceae bacterium]